jgi:hypothetical protein
MASAQAKVPTAKKKLPRQKLSLRSAAGLRGNLVRGRSRGPRSLPPERPPWGGRPSGGRNDSVWFHAVRVGRRPVRNRKYIACLRHSDAAAVDGLCRSPRGGPGGAACARYRRGRSGAFQHGIPDQHLGAAINDRVSRPSRRVNNFCGGVEGGRAAETSLSAVERLRAPSIETNPHDREERRSDRIALATRLFINQLWQATVRHRAWPATTPSPRIIQVNFDSMLNEQIIIPRERRFSIVRVQGLAA